jgi:hypothetical protein
MHSKSQDLNLKRYHESIGFSEKTLKDMRRCLKLPFGRRIYRIREKFRCFVICGLTHHGTKLNDKYHLFSKLCRYETWDDVKINRWDKIRFKYITGYKFEE